MLKKRKFTKIIFYLGIIFFANIILAGIASAETLAAKNSNPNISINFEKVPIQDALKWLAKFKHKNVVISQSVQGDISLHLQDLPWQQAINAVLESRGLVKREIGHVLYIAPLAEIANYVKQQQELEKQEPLQTLLIHLNYAKANDIAKILTGKNKSLLSTLGYVTTDDRTNSILIRDTEEQLNELQKYVKELDVSVPQVLIEARIVNIDEDYEQELGVRFGLSSGHHLSGTLKGANDLANGISPANVPIADRLNVDLPAVSTNAAHLGIALFRLAKGTLVDLELSALESEGHAEIVSNPHLLTANQQPAKIESGEEIPYQEKVAQGVTSTAFKKAVLSLNVTPQITPNHKIILHLKINQDKRGNKEVKGVPTIDTRQITTQVLVEDGQTLVLGGIYEQTKTDGVERVPYLANVPIIGNLFQHKKIINNRRESLIFVTPKIINW